MNLSLNTTINYRTSRLLWRFQRMYFLLSFLLDFPWFYDWLKIKVNRNFIMIYIFLGSDRFLNICFFRQNLIMKSDPIDSGFEVMKIYFLESVILNFIGTDSKKIVWKIHWITQKPSTLARANFYQFRSTFNVRHVFWSVRLFFQKSWYSYNDFVIYYK